MRHALAPGNVDPPGFRAIALAGHASGSGEAVLLATLTIA